MAVGEAEQVRTGLGNGAIAGASALVAAPLVLLAVLRLWPALDLHWYNHPAHFWIVLAAAAVATTLAYAVTVAARRRRDARLFMISLAFITGAGFLGLHALATPGVLVGPNAGFVLAPPVGLVVGSVFVALSTIDFGVETARRIMARSRQLLAVLLGVIGVWALISVAELPPLDDPVREETLRGWQLALAGVGVLGYGAGTLGYLQLHLRRGAAVIFAFAVAFALLAVTMIVMVFSVHWRLSWWIWHVSILVAFGIIALAARQEWHEERFSALYLEQTLEGTREASILFADLHGFTSFSERAEPQAVKAMLNGYFARLVPALQQLGGEVHQLIGDAVMVVFNKQGDQPDHALRAARAALAFQELAAEVAAEHPDWPSFRVGVNSGEVAAGVLGERGHRKYDVIGDTVNLAARLEAQAPVGKVVIGEGTRRQLPQGAVVEQLAPLRLKGKAEPVTAYVLHELPT